MSIGAGGKVASREVLILKRSFLICLLFPLKFDVAIFAKVKTNPAILV